MKNSTCKITLDVTGFGYTYLLQILDMADETPEENAGAAEALRDWIEENAEHFLDDARDARDFPAIDFFEALVEEEPEEEHDAYTLPADDARAEEIEQIILRAGLDVSLICNTNAGGYTHTVTLLGDADDIETLLEEITEEEPAADDDADDADAIEAEVAAWRENPANEDLDAALKANARDTNNDPNNLYRAGVFAGLAEAAAWMIYGRGICPDDINAINAAVYKAYGVAW